MLPYASVKPGVHIQGDGVAGRCCAHLLGQAGFAVALDEAARPRVPVILLSDPAQRLIEDVFALRGAFAGLPRITRRIVAWGKSEPVSVDHSAVVISEEGLLGLLGREASGRTSGEAPAWKIYSAKPLPAEIREHR